MISECDKKLNWYYAIWPEMGYIKYEKSNEKIVYFEQMLKAVKCQKSAIICKKGKIGLVTQNKAWY